MATHHIHVYVGDPDSVDVDLGHLKGRVEVHSLDAYEREEPVIMVLDPREEPAIMKLESPHEIELRINDVDALDAEAVEWIVKAADRGGHKLSIVQDEQVS